MMSITKPKQAAAIYGENGLTIVLNGENTVTGPDCTDEIEFSFGVYAGGGITVSGSGSLNAAGGGRAEQRRYLGGVQSNCQQRHSDSRGR